MHDYNKDSTRKRPVFAIVSSSSALLRFDPSTDQVVCSSLLAVVQSETPTVTG